MKAAIKRWVASGVHFGVTRARRSGVGRYACDEALSAAMSHTTSVRYGSVSLTFTVPNALNEFRVATFATKEPETLEWIDGIPERSVLWDVGANVGLYTCYAAKARGCTVFSFEPSVFNLELLARNIRLNGVTDRATIVPLPLSDALGCSTLNMTSMEWGGALSSFGQSYGPGGREQRITFQTRTVGLSMNDAVGILKIPVPDYVKLDVDGIEHLILKGGGDVLRVVQGVLIEIDEQFEQQVTDSAKYLTEAGLVLKEKRHAAMFDHSEFAHSYNQVWYRPLAT